VLRKQVEQKDCKHPLQDRFSVLSSKDVTGSQSSGPELLITYQKATDLLQIASVMKHASTTY